MPSQIAIISMCIPPNWNQPSYVYCDAFAFVVYSALCQPDDKSVIHPIAFHNKQLTIAEHNYTSTK